MQYDLTCPVENRGVIMKTNSKTGEPYALFKLFNLSGQVVQSVTFTVQAYDENGGKLGEIQADFSDLNGQPKEFFANTKAVSLAEFPDAKHLTIEFLEVHFEEGAPYIKQDVLTEVKLTEPDAEVKLRLLSAAGEDATCYAQDAGNYWLCVCGRPNLPEAETCVRCGRDKKYVMTHFSSGDALNKTLADMVIEEERAAEAQKEAEKEARALKNKKRKKAAFITAIVLVILVVLGAVGYFVYSGVMTLLGNSAAAKGDYLTAYARYAVANNSEKVASVSEYVRGNSNANLRFSAPMAADEENLYYVDQMFAIYKQNKTTGEKTQLGDAVGFYLNVSDGWVYYLDAQTGQGICRISTDGSRQETVYQSDYGYLTTMSLVGNELYFVLQEPLDNLTPKLQEQIAEQGGNIYQLRLYRLTIGEAKPQRVSEEEFSLFAYYKDRIYYLDQTDNSLLSIGRKGNDVTKLASGPIFSFDFHNDSLYYVDGTPDALTGMPSGKLVRAGLDGAYIEDVVADQMVISFNFDGEDLYYLAYREDGSADLRKKSGAEDVVVVENVQMFNQADGYLFYIGINGQFEKTTYDKSGFESIVPITVNEAVSE